MAVVTPLNNFMGPEGDTVTADKHYSILNTHPQTMRGRRTSRRALKPAQGLERGRDGGEVKVRRTH